MKSLCSVLLLLINNFYKIINYVRLTPNILIQFLLYLNKFRFQCDGLSCEYFCLIDSLKSIQIKIYEIIILTVTLYGSKTWSLTLRKERRQRIFENRIVKRILDRRGMRMRKGKGFILKDFVICNVQNDKIQKFRVGCAFTHNTRTLRILRVSLQERCLQEAQDIERRKLLESICCINRFTSLCKNLFNLLEFLTEAFRCQDSQVLKMMHMASKSFC